MKTLECLAPERLAELVATFPRLRLAVIGDFFLDKYLDVEPALAEISVETAKPAHQVVGIRRSPGAAGTVVSNLTALAAGKLWAVGLTGDDGESFELRRGLAALGCSTEHLHVDRQRMTPTYLKPRDRTDLSLAGEHSRDDTKNRTPTGQATQQKIIASLEKLLPELDAVIIADQAEEAECGVVSTAVRDFLGQAARRWPQVVFFADSRRQIHQYRNVTIKPNQFEAVARVNLPGHEVALDDLAAAIPRLRAKTGAAVFVTRGPAGMVVGDAEVTLVPGVKVDGPVDPTGAGDSATAGAVLALAAGATPPEAALLGNLVASITIQQLATTGTARPEELPPRLALWQSQRSG